MRTHLHLVLLVCLALTETLVEPKPSETSEDDDSAVRKREHIDEILTGSLNDEDEDEAKQRELELREQEAMRQLRDIYHKQIRPLERQFHYADLKRYILSDADIYAKPMILLVGPWSSGKSTIINYILGTESSMEELYVGAEPTTADFTVLTYGEQYRTVEGNVLVTDATQPFSNMEAFGQVFLEHLLGIELPNPLLRNVTFIDTPGILENRRQQERGYPYNAVVRWLVNRADLIFAVFDPTKLDVGIELESLFKQLKGKEAALRILLNKADSLDEQELMRVYGAIFWALAPLINVTEPPRIYVGSFWGKPYQSDDLAELFLREEKSLLMDMREVIRNRIHNKIAFIRQHAIRVRIHALLIDSYVSAYRRNKGLFNGGEELARSIVYDPDRYHIFKTILAHPNVSEYDLPESEEYIEFFEINPLEEQKKVTDFCSWRGENCPLDKLNRAIGVDLPNLLQKFQSRLSSYDSKHHYCWSGNCGGKFDADQEAPSKKWRKPKPQNLHDAANLDLQRKIAAVKASPKFQYRKGAAPNSDNGGKSRGMHVNAESTEKFNQYERMQFGYHMDDDVDEGNNDGAGDSDDREILSSRAKVAKAKKIKLSKSKTTRNQKRSTDDITITSRTVSTTVDGKDSNIQSTDNSPGERQRSATFKSGIKKQKLNKQVPQHSQCKGKACRGQKQSESKKQNTETESTQILSEDEKESKNLKALCKWRKSCYFTGVVPQLKPHIFETVVQVDEVVEVPQVIKDDPAKLKQKCKWRTSCYGNEIESPKIKKPIETDIHKPKPSIVTREEPPEPVIEKTEAPSNQKAFCKWRKSCYETGIVPEVPVLPIIEVVKSDVKEAQILAGDKNALKQKCKWKKSCYEDDSSTDMSTTIDKDTATKPVKPVSEKEAKKKKEVLEKEAETKESSNVKRAEDQSESVSAMKKKCRWRKSCYVSGIVPDMGVLYKTEQVVQNEKPTFSDQPLSSDISVQKQQCRWRKSCYEGEAEKTEQKSSNVPRDTEKKHKEPAKKKDTVKKVKPPEKQRQVSPKASDVTETAKSSSDLKQFCRWRKSCYSTGVVPDIEKERPKEEPVIQDKIEPVVVLATDESVRKQQCRWRKSCYESGILHISQTPDDEKPMERKNQAQQKSLRKEMHANIEAKKNYRKDKKAEDKKSKSSEPVSSVGVSTSSQSLKADCKWRKSCYETGLIPDLNPQDDKIPQEKQLPQIRTEEQEPLAVEDMPISSLKQTCRWRKSCYDSGIIPDLSWPSESYASESTKVEQPVVAKVKSIKERCLWRKSCYAKLEQQDADNETEKEVTKRPDEADEDDDEDDDEQTLREKEDIDEEEEAEEEIEKLRQQYKSKQTEKSETPQEKVKIKSKLAISKEKTARVAEPVPVNIEKCTKYSYRKSCKEAADAAPELSSKPAKDSHTDVKITQTSEQEKCTKYSYRKSCRDISSDDLGLRKDTAELGTSSMFVATADSVPHKPEFDQVPPETIFNDSIKCNRWRKSCRQQMGLPEKAPKSEKQKTLCRKKQTSNVADVKVNVSVTLDSDQLDSKQQEALER